MESRIDSRPWAADHSSPRSPRHVLGQLASRSSVENISREVKEFVPKDGPGANDVSMVSSETAAGGETHRHTLPLA